MNTKVKILLIVFGIIVALIATLRITNMLQFYTVPSGANYPTLKPGDHFFTTNLVNPERLDFICYRAEDQFFGKHIRVHRVGALQDDKVEIRNGILYVNDREMDSKLNLAYPYYISRNDLAKFPDIEKIPGEDIHEHGPDSMLVIISGELLRQHSIPARRHVISKHETQPDIEAKFGSPWNQDHFGPVAVPEGCYFVIGDNRHMSQDSRFSGFIKKSDVLGTVIRK